MCRRKFILKYFGDRKAMGDELIEVLGRCCDNCERDKKAAGIAEQEKEDEVGVSGEGDEDSDDDKDRDNENRAIQSLGYELALVLNVIQELKCNFPTPVIIDLLRNVKNKRSSGLPDTGAIDVLRGKGSGHPYVWWWAFVHGPVHDHGYLSHNPLKPDQFDLTSKGITCCTSNPFSNDSKREDVWPLFQTHVDIGALSRPAHHVASPPLTKRKKEIILLINEEIARLATKHRVYAFHLIPEAEVKKLVIDNDTLTSNEILAHPSFNHSLFLGLSNDRLRIASLLAQSMTDSEAQSCMYIRAVKGLCKQPAKPWLDNADEKAYFCGICICLCMLLYCTFSDPTCVYIYKQRLKVPD